jgi:hypothetical protein
MNALRRRQRLSLVAVVPGFAVCLALASPASASPLPAPTVSPNPVGAGQVITVHGTGCTANTGFPVSVEVAVLDSNNTVVVAGGGTPSKTGFWTMTLKVPGDTRAGSYLGSSTCDRYQSTLRYPTVPLTVKAGHSAPTVSVEPSSVSPGGQIAITGTGFRGGEKVRANLHSTKVLLATFTASSTGAVRGTATIPTTTALGSHELKLVGVTSGRISSTALTVVGASSASTLPETGAPLQGLLVWALVLLVAGSGAIVGAGWRLARRRGAHT